MTKDVIVIQYLRGIAAIMVVLDHLSASTERELKFGVIPRWGGFGVAIFFVISGFIMWHTTVTSDISVIEFWRRRIVRIVPLYWLVLCALVVVAVSAPQLLNSTLITPEDTLKSFFFIPHFHMVQKDLIAPILIPGWSLNYEMFFYCIFGLSLLVKAPVIRLILLGVTLVTLVVLGVVLSPSGAITATYTDPKLLAFLGGVLLATLYRPNKVSSLPLGLILLTAGLALVVLPTSNYLYGVGRFLGLSPTFLVAGALAFETSARRAPNLAFQVVGDASYSIYVSHLFFLRIAELAWRHVALPGVSLFFDATYVVFAFLLALVGGIAFYYAVERPLLFFWQRAVPRIDNNVSRIAQPTQAIASALVHGKQEGNEATHAVRKNTK
jgi:exopolysaccharide production protein ExoZ